MCEAADDCVAGSRLAERLERGVEGRKRAWRDACHRRREKSLHGRIGTLEELRASRGDAGHDYPAVGAEPFARDEVTGLESVEQACDVGITRHHTLRDFAAWNSIWTGATQNPQHVVLRCSQVEWLERLGKSTHERLGRTLKIQEDFLFDRVERLPLLDCALEGSWHRQNDICHDDECQTAGLSGQLGPELWRRAVVSCGAYRPTTYCRVAVRARIGVSFASS